MVVEAYKNPYEGQISSEALAADNKQQENDRSLFENQDMVKIIKVYLEENVPVELKEKRIYKEFWAVLGKKIQLTFLDAEDKFDFEAMFVQAKMLYYMSIPKYETDFETIATMKQLEMYFIAAIRSAIGSRDNVFNERIVQASTIRQNINSNTERFGQMGGSSGGGFFSKLGKLF
jgi:hypothetical protein